MIRIAPSVSLLAALAACATPRPATESGPQPQNPPPEAGAARTDDGAHYGRTGHRQFVMPVSQPVTFESPVVDTSIRPIFMYHRFPVSSVFDGGDLMLYAVQARFALTDRLGIIATKDGYIDLDPGAGSAIPGDTGWADIGAGFKYAFVDDKREGVLFSGGLIYEADSGDHEVLQGNGDGLLRPFLSGAKQLDQVNLMGSIAYNFPIDRDAESSSLDYHAQVDYMATPELAPFFAVHGITYTEDGKALPVNFEGGDLVNLGATMVSGQSVFSGGVGARFRITPDISVAAAYDFPIGGRRDILKDRITIDAVFHF